MTSPPTRKKIYKNWTLVIIFNEFVNSSFLRVKTLFILFRWQQIFTLSTCYEKVTLNFEFCYHWNNFNPLYCKSTKTCLLVHFSDDTERVKDSLPKKSFFVIFLIFWIKLVCIVQTKMRKKNQNCLSKPLSNVKDLFVLLISEKVERRKNVPRIKSELLIWYLYIPPPPPYYMHTHISFSNNIVLRLFIIIKIIKIWYNCDNNFNYFVME